MQALFIQEKELDVLSIPMHPLLIKKNALIDAAARSYGLIIFMVACLCFLFTSFLCFL